MDTINTLLSLIELRIQMRDVREWQQQVPLYFQLLRNLHAEEAQLLSQRLLARSSFQDEEDDVVLRLLAQINLLHPGVLASLLPTLVTHRQWYPCHLYLYAGEHISQQILELLPAPSEKRKGLLLQALAWIGAAAVHAHFAAFRASPPDWTSELSVSPEHFTLDAGWELTADGKRRDLCFSQSIELVRIEHAASIPATFPEQTATQQRCGWCQRLLHTLLDLELRDPRCRWITSEGERLCLAVCPHCSFYTTTYLDLTLTGEARWSPLNGEMPEPWSQLPDDDEVVELPAPLSLGLTRSTPFEAVGRFLLDEQGTSQLGGYPEWIQDPFYPQCPACQQTMSFLGQIAFEDWEEDGEGVFYLFLCLPCRKVATHYQQT